MLFEPPAGKPLPPLPPLESVRDVLGWLDRWAEEHGLALGPEVNRPRWDGSRPNYKMTIECLLEGW